MWAKEKLLVMSNFSFSHSVFKRLEQKTCKNQGLFGKGLSPYQGLVTFFFSYFPDQKDLKLYSHMQLKGYLSGKG